VIKCLASSPNGSRSASARRATPADSITSGRPPLLPGARTCTPGRSHSACGPESTESPRADRRTGRAQPQPTAERLKKYGVYGAAPFLGGEWFQRLYDLAQRGGLGFRHCCCPGCEAHNCAYGWLIRHMEMQMGRVKLPLRWQRRGCVSGLPAQ
jgi:hypothetical protein